MVGPDVLGVICKRRVYCSVAQGPTQTGALLSSLCTALVHGALTGPGRSGGSGKGSRVNDAPAVMAIKSLHPHPCTLGSSRGALIFCFQKDLQESRRGGEWPSSYAVLITGRAVGFLSHPGLVERFPAAPCLSAKTEILASKHICSDQGTGPCWILLILPPRPWSCEQ